MGCCKEIIFMNFKQFIYGTSLIFFSMIILYLKGDEVIDLILPSAILGAGIVVVGLSFGDNK